MPDNIWNRKTVRERVSPPDMLVVCCTRTKKSISSNLSKGVLWLTRSNASNQEAGAWQQNLRTCTITFLTAQVQREVDIYLIAYFRPGVASKREGCTTQGPCLELEHKQWNGSCQVKYNLPAFWYGNKNVWPCLRIAVEEQQMVVRY